MTLKLGALPGSMGVLLLSDLQTDIQAQEGDYPVYPKHLMRIAFLGASRWGAAQAGITEE